MLYCFVLNRQHFLLVLMYLDAVDGHETARIFSDRSKHFCIRNQACLRYDPILERWINTNDCKIPQIYSTGKYTMRQCGTHYHKLVAGKIATVLFIQSVVQLAFCLPPQISVECNNWFRNEDFSKILPAIFVSRSCIVGRVVSRWAPRSSKSVAGG